MFTLPGCKDIGIRKYIKLWSRFLESIEGVMISRKNDDGVEAIFS